ncbi:MAG TPA: glyoxalase [Dehalococcoidia bacterium]|jgi:catechol-2,3-dioxygenase|nr:glyoxalase [Dehalococcoidia bacterium]
MMVDINKVGHVVLKVRDLEKSAEWYSRVLGMEIMTRAKDFPMIFLSFGNQHHDIALMKAPDGAEMGGLGLAHVAMQINGGEEKLRQLYGRLLSAGVSINHVWEHSVSRSVYFLDPDGIELEIFCETMGLEQGMEVMRGSDGGAEDIELEPIFES